MDMSDYGISNTEGYRYISLTIDKFKKLFWCYPLKNKYGKTLSEEFSKSITNSKRKPDKLKSERGKEFSNSTFQNLLKLNNLHHYSRYTDKSPSIAEQTIRKIRILLNKPLIETRNSDWLSEIKPIIKKYNNTYHNSIKMTPNKASKK